MSLRWKLALALVLVSSLATIAFGAASYRSTEQRLMADVDRSLVEVEPAAIERALGGAALASDGFERVRVQIEGPHGVVLQTTFPEPVAWSGHRASAIATVRTSKGDYRVRAIEFANGAVAVVGRPLDETHRVLRGVRNRTLFLIALVAALAAVIGVLLADRITAPLRRLAAASDDVARSGRPQLGLPNLPSEQGHDEVGRLSAGFGRMLGALARSQEEQERLVQDAGHELRTPLTSLRTNLDTLRRFPDIPPEQRAAIVDDLHAEVEELSALVDEIVAVAGGGLTGDGAGEAYDDFDLTALAVALGERYARRSGRQVLVTGDASAGGVTVVAQHTGVQRAISCLLDNARKFDTSDAPIEVAVSSADGFARVIVGDRGPGIPEAELELVFDRFHRADAARTMPGSGLGLSIVRAVAERHGGTATAANRPGGGAEVGFTVRLEPA